MLYGQPSGPHVHGDKLGLWIGAFGYHLLAAAGGYPFTWISPKFQSWEVHSAASTVVVVDGKNQKFSYSKQQCHYEGAVLSVAGMTNTVANPGTHNERWCWVIQAPNREDAYVVDLNFALHGNTFDYNTIGLNTSFEQTDFAGIKPEEWISMEGTVAGSEVPLYSSPGQGWMKALRKARVSRPVSWTYRYGGAALKIHTVPNGEQREVICCLGEIGGQEMGKSQWQPFILWRDQAEEGENHAASFYTIVEPFESDPFIRSVHPMQWVSGGTETAFEPLGAEIEYPDDYRDILISTYSEGDAVCFRDRAGIEYATDAKALILRYKGEELVHIEALSYTFISAGAFQTKRKYSALTGQIVSVNIENRMIEVALDHVYEEAPHLLEGQTAFFDSPDYEKPCPYYITKPQINGNRLTFTTGIPLIKLDADWQDPEKKLGLGKKQVQEIDGKKVLVDVKPGDRFKLYNTIHTIPLSERKD